MAITAILQYGTLPDNGTLVDEADLLVQSLTISATREKKAYKGTNRATQGLSYTDPTITFAFKAYLGALNSDLGTGHPGEEVTSLANATGERHGFDSSGTKIYEDPSTELTNEDADMVSFNIVQYPFVV